MEPEDSEDKVDIKRIMEAGLNIILRECGELTPEIQQSIVSTLVTLYESLGYTGRAGLVGRHVGIESIINAYTNLIGKPIGEANKTRLRELQKPYIEERDKLFH